MKTKKVLLSMRNEEDLGMLFFVNVGKSVLPRSRNVLKHFEEVTAPPE